MSLFPYFQHRSKPIWFMDDFFDEDLWSIRPSVRGKDTPYSEVKNLEDHYEVDIHLAGIPKDNVNIELKGGVLSIKGEKGNENNKISYTKSWSVDKSITEDDISASYNEGLLKLKVNKKTKEPVSIKIPIK